METYIEKKSGSSMKRYLLVTMLVIVFVLGVMVGRSGNDSEVSGKSVETATTTIKNTNVVKDLPREIDFQQFWDIWNKIEKKSVKRPIDEQKLFYGALQGMVAALEDPYSVYFTPTIAKEFQEELKGSFSGIGAELGAKDGSLIIVAPLPESPAERAGLRAGDTIVGINDESAVGLAVDAAVKKIRGEKGTPVTLHISRKNVKELLTIKIIRDKIELKSVRNEMLSDSIELITISSFNEQTQPQFEEAIKVAQEKKVSGIVLDLRNNPGGFFDESIAVASEWLKDGDVVVSQRGNDKTTREDFRAIGSHRLRGIPTVVLINGGSASASEIVAGALHDQGVATLVGAKSFGKGSVQEYEELGDGSALKLTVALWYTPKDVSINESGIKPDIEIAEKKDSPTDISLPIGRIDAKSDAAIQRALQILNGKK